MFVIFSCIYRFNLVLCYFVCDIIMKAASMGGTEERNTRMENMSWRIWNLARKKKQVNLLTNLTTIFVFTR